MGDAVATNVFLLGYAWQKGWIPLQEAALLKAIELNGAAVRDEPGGVRLGTPGRARPAGGARRRRAGQARVVVMMPPRTPSLDALLADRTQRLTAYQNAAYAAALRALRARDRSARAGSAPAATGLPARWR